MCVCGFCGFFAAQQDIGFQAQKKEIEKNFAHGTTTLGFVFNKGIVIAVDSRATMGQYICTLLLLLLLLLLNARWDLNYFVCVCVCHSFSACEEGH